MPYNTKIKPQNFSGEINDGETLVEPAGYIPAKVQIESFIEAGRRLNESRKQEFYDINSDQDDEEFVPTREPGFDLADASNLLNGANERLKASREAEKKAQEASRVAKDALVEEKASEGPSM